MQKYLILLKWHYCYKNMYKDYANIKKTIYLKKLTETNSLIYAFNKNILKMIGSQREV